MARYSSAVRTPAAAAGAPYCDFRPAASDRCRILEVGVFTSAATASSIGLIRTLTTGTATTTQAGVPNDPAEAAGTALIGTAWSTAPTIAGTPLYKRRIALPATAASGVIWTWPTDGPVFATNGATTGLVLWNFGGSAGSALDVYWVWDE